METFTGLIGNIGTLLIALIAYKSGLLKFLINGRFWNGSKTDNGNINEVKEQLKNLKENHFHELSEGQKDIKTILRDMQINGIRIRKD